MDLIRLGFVTYTLFVFRFIIATSNLEVLFWILKLLRPKSDEVKTLLEKLTFAIEHGSNFVGHYLTVKSNYSVMYVSSWVESKRLCR